MFEITKVYRQTLPALRFIGKKYSDTDRDEHGSFSSKWGEFFANGWFEDIEKTAGGSDACRDLYEDGDAYLGLMRYAEGQPFQYCVGMFVPSATSVPEGFSAVDFEESALGVCWVHGAENEVYGHEGECAAKLNEEGILVDPRADGGWWFFERYGCPRFTTPDENGKIILDICHFLG
jgi:hypothetical protein